MKVEIDANEASILKMHRLGEFRAELLRTCLEEEPERKDGEFPPASALMHFYMYLADMRVNSKGNFRLYPKGAKGREYTSNEFRLLIRDELDAAYKEAKKYLDTLGEMVHTSEVMANAILLATR